MTLLHKARPEMCYLKMGIYGEAGSGKTFTSSKIAIGLHKHIKAEKPVAFVDTETGSDFVLPRFKEEKIELITAKTKAFKDLLDIIDEAEKSASILIIDSVSHFWKELTKSYQKQHNLSRITLRHWIPLKQTWEELTNRYVNSNLHIILAGRSAYIWDDVEDEDGAKELKKTGTKMRAETEMGYEPSLLVEMEKMRTSNRTGAKWTHRAWVIKDRFDVIDGKHFDNPTIEAFLPHIELLNLGGKHRAVDQDRNSQEMFENNRTGENKYRQKKILLEKIQNGLVKIHPGQTQEDKKGKLGLLERCFGTDSMTEIEGYENEFLDKGLGRLRDEYRKINGKKKKEDKKK